MAATTPVDTFCLGSRPTATIRPASTEAATARPMPMVLPLALPNCGKSELLMVSSGPKLNA